MTTERIEEWFSANYLDGDDVQKGQMLSSEECLDAVTRAHQAGIDEVADRGWEYLIKAVREESGSKEEYIKALQDKK